MNHGSVWSYSNYGCRCAECTAKWAEYNRAKRQSRHNRAEIPVSVVHGKMSTYQNWKCRCEPCRQAAAQYRRDYRVTAKQRANRARRQAVAS